MTFDDQQILKTAEHTLNVEAESVSRLVEIIDNNFVEAVKSIASTRGKVIVSGMGKSGHIGKKISATLASTGTPSIFMHPGEAAHGDLGLISPDDIVLLISNSGETQELYPVIAFTQRAQVSIISITGPGTSFLAKNSNVNLAMPLAEEACPIGIAPTTSTIMTLALGDAIAMAVMKVKGFSKENFRDLHPGGKIGLRLAQVSEFMHSGDSVPIVPQNMPMLEVIVEMTAKSFGVAAVVDAGGRLVGVISDGDLRRNQGDLSSTLARDIMNSNPHSIEPSVLAEDAMKFLNEMGITALFIVMPDKGNPIGVVHVHDFLRLGLMG